MLLTQEQRPTLAQRIDPKIILASTILQLNSIELVQAVDNELLDNPALEAVEETGCGGACPNPAECPYCSSRSPSEQTISPDQSFAALAFDDPVAAGVLSQEEEPDVMGNIQAELTLAEHLSNQLRTALPHEDYWIGEYIVSSLDERGWMAEPPEEVAASLSIDEATVCAVLSIVQSLDPAGVGARSLQECLLLQLKELREDPLNGDRLELLNLAYRILEQHFDEFCRRRFSRLARLCKCSVDSVKEVADYVRQYLNPFPASQFRPPWDYRPTTRKGSVRADVIIRRTASGYDVEVVNTDSRILAVNPQYRIAHEQLSSSRERRTSPERKHVAEYVERAERFIRNIELRRRTLRQITRRIIDCQPGFLETGSMQFLRPLTRTQIAQSLSIHESTVSRATSNKYVQLPGQEVVPFEVFFDSSLSVKTAIEELIRQENSSDPLSDQQIVDKLEEKGIHVARRTVVKYRQQQKILSSSHRRR